MDWYPMIGGWAGAWMWLVMFLIVFLVAAFAAVLARGPRPHEPETPVAIAARRLARGEISKEEFEQLKAALSNA